jgi:hypothetical protein
MFQPVLSSRLPSQRLRQARLAARVLLLLAVAFQLACNEQDNTRRFLTTLDDAQQVSLSVKQFVEQTVVTKKLKPQTGIAIIEQTEKLDVIGEQLALESQKYLIPVLDDGGVPIFKDGKPLRVVRFTQTGKDNVTALVQSFSGVANGLIDDPRLNELAPADREHWRNLSTALARVVANSFQLVKQIKPVK